MLPNPQLLQENLGMQGAINLLNNVYNLVHQQNGQFLKDKILRIEENLQYVFQKIMIYKDRIQTIISMWYQIKSPPKQPHHMKLLQDLKAATEVWDAILFLLTMREWEVSILHVNLLVIVGHRCTIIIRDKCVMYMFALHNNKESHCMHAPLIAESIYP